VDGALQGGEYAREEGYSGFPAMPGNVGETVEAFASEAIREFPLVGG
jgi:hypothetical protein